MKPSRLLALGALAFIGHVQAGLVTEWPKLTGDQQGPCAQALQIAHAAFKASAPQLYAPLALPPALTSTLVLGTTTLDISGGDALQADPAVFHKEQGTENTAYRNVYWQKSASRGARLLMAERPLGWRGDMYTLFAIPETEDVDKALAALKQEDKPPSLRSVVQDSWRPPLVFQTKDKQTDTWLIDVGQPHQILADWRVHVPQAGSVEPACTIQFRPHGAQALKLLPSAVRQLAALLDKTMGPGENEGSLQATAHLRMSAAQTWANAAWRPWARISPYNTRAEVDKGLQRWANAGAGRRAIYQAIQQQYPLAEQALANDYRHRFNRSPQEAQALSAYVLDGAFRTHFVFHSDAPRRHSKREGVAENPWQQP